MNFSVPGIIGCLQALEAIKIASAVGEPLVGRMLLFDALSGRLRIVCIIKFCYELRFFLKQIILLVCCLWNTLKSFQPISCFFFVCIGQDKRQVFALWSVWRECNIYATTISRIWLWEVHPVPIVCGNMCSSALLLPLAWSYQGCISSCTSITLTCFIRSPLSAVMCVLLIFYA